MCRTAGAGSANGTLPATGMPATISPRNGANQSPRIAAPFLLRHNMAG